jgi:hypothetical protein
MMTDVTAPAAIGRLQIGRRLGAGGFATVWLAHDPELDSPVAVKILAENFAAHADVRRRFIDEARLLRRVDSDHLVRVYDVGELRDGRPFFVMTFADRGSLAERMTQVPPPWPAPSVVAVVDAVADGLTVLHRHGVVHRDLKPVNVLLRSDPDGTERVLLGDLGIAKDLQWASGLTVPAGSSGYAAPEQELYSEQIGPATDVHALAVTAGQLLGLQPPWPATPMGAVLTRATDPDPDRRTSSASAFAAELRESLEPDLAAAPASVPHPPPLPLPPPAAAVTEFIPGFAPSGTTAGAPPRRRLRVPLAVGAAVLVAGTGAVAGWAGWNVLRGPHRISPTDRHVSIEVPRDLTRREDAAFPGRGDPRAGKRASADQRSVTVAYDPVSRDARQVLADVQPQDCARTDSRTGRVGSWPGRKDRYTCPDGVTVDEVVLTGGGSRPFTVWVEVKSVSGSPDLTSILSSLDVSND